MRLNPQSFEAKDFEHCHPPHATNLNGENRENYLTVVMTGLPPRLPLVHDSTVAHVSDN